MPTAKKKKQTLEEALTRLEEITGIMERMDTPLEESLELYKEGVGLSVFCAGLLEHVKQEITILQKSSIIQSELFNEKPFITE